MAKAKILTAERARECLDYDQNTGNLVWIERAHGRPKSLAAGTTGSSKRFNGGGRYLSITIDKIKYPLHQVIWVWMTGEWPNRQIDHINLDRHDNRWSNLRLATPSQNTWNNRISTRNKSGFVGIWWNAPRGKWEAFVGKKNLGRFATMTEAIAARQKAAHDIAGEFLHPTKTAKPRRKGW